MEQAISVNTWEDCQNEIRKIEQQTNDIQGVWFRGQSNSNWSLDTTLERYSKDHPFSFEDYYKVLRRIRPAVETMTGSAWELPNPETINELVSSYDSLSIKLRNGGAELAYKFLAHLRHHSFPSPLLD